MQDEEDDDDDSVRLRENINTKQLQKELRGHCTGKRCVCVCLCVERGGGGNGLTYCSASHHMYWLVRCPAIAAIRITTALMCTLLSPRHGSAQDDSDNTEGAVAEALAASEQHHKSCISMLTTVRDVLLLLCFFVFFAVLLRPRRRK